MLRISDFMIIAFNSGTGKTELQDFPPNEIKNLYRTQKGGNKIEYCRKVGEEYQIAARKETAKDLQNKKIEEFIKIRKGENKVASRQREYTYKISGDKIVFGEPIPELIPFTTVLPSLSNTTVLPSLSKKRTADNLTENEPAKHLVYQIPLHSLTKEQQLKDLETQKKIQNGLNNGRFYPPNYSLEMQQNPNLKIPLQDQNTYAMTQQSPYPYVVLQQPHPNDSIVNHQPENDVPNYVIVNQPEDDVINPQPDVIEIVSSTQNIVEIVSSLQSPAKNQASLFYHSTNDESQNQLVDYLDNVLTRDDDVENLIRYT